VAKLVIESILLRLRRDTDALSETGAERDRRAADGELSWRVNLERPPVDSSLSARQDARPTGSGNSTVASAKTTSTQWIDRRKDMASVAPTWVEESTHVSAKRAPKEPCSKMERKSSSLHQSS
jgi:hypothetical protein